MRVADFVPWKRLRADDHFLYGGSDHDKPRHKQHTELGGDRNDQHCHHAGGIHLHVGKRFNQHEPNGDDQLHSDRNQCRGLDHVNSNRYRKHGKQASDQLLYSQPQHHSLGLQQHAELGNDRCDQSCDYAGSIYFHIRERVDEREPIRDNHLHAYRDRCCGLDHIHGKGHCSSVRWAIGDSDHFVPRRDTRQGVCGVHDSRQRRLSALHLFRKHEFQLSSIT